VLFLLHVLLSGFRWYRRVRGGCWYWNAQSETWSRDPERGYDTDEPDEDYTGDF